MLGNQTYEKIAIVTGANSGMGKETTAALADKGYTVIMLCRNQTRGESALRDLTVNNGNRNIKLMLCDLADMKSIIAFTNEFKKSYLKLDVLVNNAGLFFSKRKETKDGFEMQFGVCHIGHFLLTLRLLDYMKSGSRIVIVASMAQKIGKIHFEDYNLTKNYNMVKAYCQAKLANVLFTRELSSRINDRGITVNCLHPGIVATSMGIDRKADNIAITSKLMKLFSLFSLTAKEGCTTAVYLATSTEVANITGEYFYKCRVVKTSKRAQNADDAKRLFELSEKLTGERL